MIGRADDILARLMGRPLVADPFPLYHELRELAPVHRDPNGIWYVTRYDDCEHVFRSQDFGHHGKHFHGGTSGRRAELLSLMFSFDDPPVHTRKRGAVAGPFSASATAAHRRRMRHLVDELLGAITSGDVVDLDQRISAQLPVLVTCDLLDVPEPDRDRCAKWIDLMTSSNQPVMTGEHAGQLLADADAAAESLSEYFAWLTERPADEMRGPVLPALSLLVRRGDWSWDEVTATLILLMAAGFETTRYTITGGLAAIASEPAVWDRLREMVLRDDDVPNTVVEELLRHQGPIHGALARTSTVDERFGDVVVPAGEPVIAMVAAANRDPAVYDDPDEFRPERDQRRPLSFGAGAHYCLGAFLARDEIRLAVTGVLTRFRRLEILEPPGVKGSFNVRGPQALRARVH